MNLSSKFVAQFTNKFKRNLQEEIRNNKNLTQKIENIARLKANILDLIQNSKTIKIADKIIITPLRTCDSLLFNMFDKTTEAINFNISNKIQSFASQNLKNYVPQKIKGIDNIIPKYYGGNKFTKIKQNEHKYNRDEKSISYLENKVIPNIFFNKDLKLKDEKSQAYINFLYDYIKNKYKLKNNHFFVIDCIDYRNVETNGYDKNENIGFNFDLQFICKYFDRKFVVKKLCFSCFLKFDGYDNILQLDFDET